MNQQTLNCKGQLLDLSTPIIMGILNITPDSFYDGGRYHKEKDILQQTEKMLEEGAQIIDIGGMSSRPGAKVVAVEEELSRVLPAIQAIHQRFPKTVLSIDTVHSRVAQEAIGAGAGMINDISAGSIDKNMFDVVAQLTVPYVLMHMQGLPENMQKNPKYDHLLVTILDFFIQKIAELRSFGVKDIILDVGFGFGKTLSQNYELLKHLASFHCLQLPLLVGVSRKSMIYKLLDITPSEALNGTTVIHTWALQSGAKILRVHDVKAAKETIKIMEML